MTHWNDATSSHPDHDGLRAQHLDGWFCRLCDGRCEVCLDYVHPTKGLTGPDGRWYCKRDYPFPGRPPRPIEDVMVAPPTARPVGPDFGPSNVGPSGARFAATFPYAVHLYADWADHDGIHVGFQSESDARRFAAGRPEPLVDLVRRDGGVIANRRMLALRPDDRLRDDFPAEG